MINLKTIRLFLRDWYQILICLLKTTLKSRIAKDLEIIALRSQLSLMQEQILNHKIPKPKPTPAFRQLLVLISKLCSNWRSFIMIVKPETVIGWHRTAFRFYWTRKSKPRGRPKISKTTIALIKRIHKENPLWSPERIHDQLINLGITDAPAPNTIAKYFPGIRKPPTEKRQQSWKNFLVNHRKDIWAMDFFVVPTLYFKVLYVFLVISHDRRKIEHFAVTTNPTSAWVAHQLREATPFGVIPDYLIHDNDTIFTAKTLQDFLANSKIKSVRTSFRSPWQNGICERAIGILRRELLDHIIPFNEKHLDYLLREYVRCYYNPIRTHQGIRRQTPILLEKPPETLIVDTALVSKTFLGGLYHNYRKAA